MTPAPETVFVRALRHAAHGIAAGAAALWMAGCGGGAQPPAGSGGPGGPGGGPPPMPVEAITLATKPVEDIGEFIGTLKSRHTTTVQPQAEGFITKILVKSGDHVKPGDVLVEIDAKSQQAAVSSLESVRAVRDSDVTLARQLAVRAKQLLDVGATSQQEYEQAVAAQRSAEAQLGVVEEQIRQQRNELGYYHVTASTSGVVGDIPVRQGDRVTKTTAITTIDDNTGLEVFLYVPVQQATRLRLGLPVRIVNDTGETLENETVSFVAASVDDATQTVLVKTPVSGAASRFRSDQYVRVRVIWKTDPGLTIPVVAVTRINGAYFVYVVENGPRGAVAHQRSVTVGPIVGNDYVVLGGIKAGEQLIVGGIQKIGDGSPVRPGPPASGGPAAPGTAGGK